MTGVGGTDVGPSAEGAVGALEPPVVGFSSRGACSGDLPAIGSPGEGTTGREGTRSSVVMNIDAEQERPNAPLIHPTCGFSRARDRGRAHRREPPQRHPK